MILQFGDWSIWAGAALIFLARVIDVTLGTLRISFISKGEKAVAPLIGFFEILIWLFAISQVIQNMNNVVYYFAYAGGFAGGVFTGLQIEDRMALGSRMIRTITREDARGLLDALRSAGYGVTSLRAQGASGDVDIIFSVVQRSEIEQYMALVEEHNPRAFSSIEDVRTVRQGVFRMRKSPLSFKGASSLRWKSK